MQHPLILPRAVALTVVLGLAALSAAPAAAAETVYQVDPSHTYPSFEADHLGGLSVWRGKFNTSSGQVRMDKDAGSGSVEVEIDVASVDFGNDAMNEVARGDTLFDAAKHPRATYRGKLVDFSDGKPGAVDGTLRLHGVERPLRLEIVSFKCMPHPQHKRELCGADARGSFQRDAFGMDAGKDYGFDMTVPLRIQVEAVAEAAPAE
jgi:polyisoprenoid-binding protein YceI